MLFKMKNEPNWFQIDEIEIDGEVYQVYISPEEQFNVFQGIKFEEKFRLRGFIFNFSSMDFSLIGTDESYKFYFNENDRLILDVPRELLSDFIIMENAINMYLQDNIILVPGGS